MQKYHVLLLSLALIFIAGCQKAKPKVTEILTYRVDRQAADADPNAKLDEFVSVIDRRLNSSDLKVAEVVADKDDHIIVRMFATNPEFIASAKKCIPIRGTVEFRILANPSMPAHRNTIALAEDSKQRDVVVDGTMLANWVPVDMEQNPDFSKWHPRIARENDDGTQSALVMVSPFDVNGSHIRRAAGSIDSAGKPGLNFELNDEGAALMKQLTENHLPDPNSGMRHSLGIIFNGKLISAPNLNDVISKFGQITGNFTMEQIDFMAAVLTGGALPAPLILESETMPESVGSP